MTLHCFQVASSCILPSIMCTPRPSGIASITFFANLTSSGSGLNTRFAISSCAGWSDHAPTQPMRNEARNWVSQPSVSLMSPNGPQNGRMPVAAQASTMRPVQAGTRLELREQPVHVVDVPGALDLRDHDHLELVPDLGDERRQVVQHPWGLERVHARPERGLAEVDLLAHLHEALARGLLAV